MKQTLLCLIFSVAVSTPTQMPSECFKEHGPFGGEAGFTYASNNMTLREEITTTMLPSTIRLCYNEAFSATQQSLRTIAAIQLKLEDSD